MIALPAAAALLSGARRSIRLSLLLVPATACIVLGIVTAQTRLALGAAVIALFAFVALTLTSRRGLTAFVLTTAIALGGWFAVSAFVSSSVNRYTSIQPSHVIGTVLTGRKGSFGFVGSYLGKYPLGAGIGSVGPAGALNKRANTTAHSLNGETEMTFLIVETVSPGCWSCSR